MSPEAKEECHGNHGANADDVMTLKADGVFLSNEPGDPEPAAALPDAVIAE